MTAWLLTWLWQGTALAALMAILLVCAPRLNATTKHVIWSGVLLALAWLGLAASPHLYPAFTAVPVQRPDFIGPRLAAPMYVPSAPDFVVTVAIGMWTAVSLVNLVRLIPALHAMDSLRDRCRPFPARLEAQLPLWQEMKNRGRRAQLKLSDGIGGATLLGLHNPCIAIPASLVNALSPAELDLVILHEYAHVQRRDDWVRLAQSLAQAALWVHPAAVLVSRTINREREVACDEWVVARTGRPNAYARCLLHAAEACINVRETSALLPAFVGRRHDLERRVNHLLAMRGTTRHRVSIAAAAAGAAAIIGISMSMQATRFSEIGTIALPHVATPPFARTAAPVLTPVVRVVSTPMAAQTSVRVDAAATPAVETASVEIPNAPVGPAVLQARTFEAPVDAIAPAASLIASTPLAIDAAAARRNWRSIAAPGVEIAAAARKTSVGVANVFSRAQGSLARRF